MITQQEKNIGLIAYITFVGMIIAYFMNRDLRSAYVTAQVKTMFGLVIILLVSVVMQTYVSMVAGEILWLISFILWAIALVYAVRGKIIVFPLLSERFMKWFTFLE